MTKTKEIPRLMVRKNLYSDFDFECSVSHIIEQLQEIIDAHPGQRLFFEHEQPPYSDYYQYNLYTEVPESDKEYQKRVKKIEDERAQKKNLKKKQEEIEFATFVKLQKKYGNKLENPE